MDMSEQPHLVSTVEKPALLQSSKYPVPESARGRVALLSDFTLLVWESYKADHAVLEYQQLLQRYDVPFSVRLVSADEVHAALDWNGAKVAARRAYNISDVQIRAINLIKEAVKLGASDIQILNYPIRTSPSSSCAFTACFSFIARWTLRKGKFCVGACTARCATWAAAITTIVCSRTRAFLARRSKVLASTARVSRRGQWNTATCSSCDFFTEATKNVVR
ncbi:hypothetical protein BUMB_02448c [Candidatus Paraburkholderia calva]|nr:hypothetical protein BUMB_02448c [Candidatus Paraburkholderia calva]